MWLNNAANIDSVVSTPYIVLIPSIHQLASNEAVCFSYKLLALILATEIWFVVWWLSNYKKVQ